MQDNFAGQSGGTLQEVRELREIVSRRKEDIDKVFTKIKDIEGKMNNFLREIMEI